MGNTAGAEPVVFGGDTWQARRGRRVAGNARETKLGDKAGGASMAGMAIDATQARGWS